MTDAIFSFIGAICGSIIGGFFAYYSATTLWNRQLIYKKKNILKGFLWEISNISKRTKILQINQRIDPLNRPQENPPPIAIIEVVDTLTPFYSENGLFFIFRNDIFNLSSELFEKLSEYYNDILEAEIYRKKLPSENLSNERSVNIEVKRNYNFMLEEIKASERLFNGLVFDLKNEISQIQTELSVGNKDNLISLLTGFIILLLLGYFFLFLG